MNEGAVDLPGTEIAMNEGAVDFPGTVRRILILVVEDNIYIQELLAVVLERVGSYSIFQVTSGAEAFTAARTLRPDLLLLDQHLPDMTGLHVYDQIHAWEEFQHLPAILMSAMLPECELEKRQLSGLQKPFHLKQLLKMIQRAINNRAEDIYYETTYFDH